MITITDFMDLSIDDNCQLIEIWDNEKECTLYKGYYYEMPYKYGQYEIESWNCIADFGICFNISL